MADEKKGSLATRLNRAGWKPKTATDTSGLAIGNVVALNIIPMDPKPHGVTFGWTVTVDHGGERLTATVEAKDRDGGKAVWSETMGWLETK